MEKTLTYNGSPLFYRTEGSGPVIVFLHGVAEDGNIWKTQSELYSGIYRVIVPDLPGSGRSAASGAPSMEYLADAVKAIFDAEEMNEAIMVGHSMGGYVTLAFAGKYGDRLKAFGLFHSSAFADNAEKIKSRDKNIAFIKNHGTLAYLQQSTPTLFSDGFKQQHPETVSALTEQYKDFDPNSLAAYHEAMKTRPDTTDVLKEFVKPVLFIIGKHDNAVPFEDSMKQCHLPEVSYIHIFEESGHMGMLEEPDNTKNAFQTFFKDIHARFP